MYEQYSQRKKRSVWTSLNKLLLLIPIGFLICMFHLDSQKIKNTYKKIELEQQKFLENFDVYVYESGYMKKQSGVQEIYIPSLIVRVTNLSEEVFNNLVFYANFNREEQIFCRGSATLRQLKSMETKDVYLRCVNSAIFGSIVTGLSLMDTFSKVQYFVSLFHDNQRVTVAEGILDFNVLYP